MRLLRWLQSIDRPLDLEALRAVRLVFLAPLISFWVLILLGEDFLLALADVGAGTMFLCGLFTLWIQFIPSVKPKNDQAGGEAR